MGTLTGLWFKASNKLLLDWPSLQPLWYVAKPDLKLDSHLMQKKLVQDSSGEL